MNEDLRALKTAGDPVGGFGGKPVGEEPDLSAHLLCQVGAAAIGEEVESFISEDAGTAWFEEDEGEAGFDLRGYAVEDFGEVGAGVREEAEVVKGAAAADVSLGGLDAEAGLG